MHELGIARSIIGIVERALGVGGVQGRVRVVRVRVGRLSTMVPENLRFLFGALVAGTPLHGSRLEIEEVPVRARGRGCGAEFEIAEPDFRCARCASADLELRSGDELAVSSVEYDEEEG